MATFVAWGNIRQDYPFQTIPSELVPERLHLSSDGESINGNSRVRQRHHCRRLAHFLLWRLCGQAGIDTGLLSHIYYTASGRPEFPSNRIDFNISHSGDWVAVILSVSSAKPAVGIDIEIAKTERNFTALLAHFAPQTEQRWLAKQSNIVAGFYRCWCLREAVLKSQGVGIVKLSEVRHLPERQQIRTAYCPAGQLFFSEELPFYLALFAAGNELDDVRYFHWSPGTERGLCAYSLKSAVKYSVNF
ncbi:4'-phosphopantetheinyl transferase [Actinobacillus succinogenes]|nr:4'-phosphopantetheinyl transferase superfamily protein [Actinobacillus succinogenes]PHI39360.1 4'-phosphopantetheinyl transferase [Actinobacillus succinogenes]